MFAIFFGPKSSPRDGFGIEFHQTNFISLMSPLSYRDTLETAQMEMYVDDLTEIKQISFFIILLQQSV